MGFPGRNLYQKIILWLLLNVLVILGLGLAFVIYMLFGSSNGLVPVSYFSKNVENTMRIISAEIQYRPMEIWEQTVSGYSEDKLQFFLVNLENPGPLAENIPDRVLEVARTIPRAPFTIAPEPSAPVPDSQTGLFSVTYEFEGQEVGIPPSPPAIFIRTNQPTRYWFGRLLYVSNEEGILHRRLLLISSSSFSGDGLFFPIRTAVLLFLGLMLICTLWWLPFVRHISRPLIRMTDVAEYVASDKLLSPSEAVPETGVPPTRRDEIGRLARAVDTMTKRVKALVSGQREFIKNIAHELHSPAARVKLGLAVLEDGLEGEQRERATKALKDMDKLTALTEQVLAYMRAKAILGQPVDEPLDLGAFVTALARSEGEGAQIVLELDQPLSILADREYVRRAVSNVLRNAVKYAGDNGPITISGQRANGMVCLIFRDKGPGVRQEELPLLTEPFFRGRAVLEHPGGAGLGLALAHHCMEYYQGSLNFKNLNPGFEVRLCWPEHLSDC